MLRNILIGCGYLILHFIIQTLYQYDRLCPKQQWNPNSMTDPEDDGMCPKQIWNSNSTTDTEDETNPCRIWAFRLFERWSELMKDMAKVITFLVGFYVSTNVRRWWEQVSHWLDWSGQL